MSFFEITIPLWVVLAFTLLELIRILVSRALWYRRDHDCSKCKVWECEGKWCWARANRKPRHMEQNKNSLAKLQKMRAGD